MTRTRDLPIGIVQFARPKPWPTPCSSCGGEGVTGERYTMQTDRCMLLVDVFCDACGGCGNGDQGHAGCPTGRDRTVHPAWVDIDDEEDDETDEPTCWSCQGRQWNPVQGFSGEDADCRMVVLRVPCGCASDRLEFLERVRLA